MTETRGERRAETAKQSDDSDIIDAAIEESAAPAQQGSGGGNLQRDVATQAERDQVEDPEAHESVKKGDHMAQGQHSDEPHPATKVVTER
jgi:hypothetical protein